MGREALNSRSTWKPESVMCTNWRMDTIQVWPNLGEDALKKTGYNSTVWNWKQLCGCRVTGLWGKHMPEAQSFSFAKCHQEVQMWRTGGEDLLSPKGAVGSCINS